MPLVLLSGYPSSGKTYRSHQLLDFFNQKIALNASLPHPDSRIARLKVHHINDQSLGLSRDVYREARPEKDARAAEYSAVKRVLGADDIVIADGLNYIKGFRYQLYCDAKAMHTPSCVVSHQIHVGTPISTCRETNKRLLADPLIDGGYPEDIFDDLVFRYEEPNGMTRWDSPLFTVVADDATPPCEQIWEAMVGSEGRAKVAKPNQATVLVWLLPHYKPGKYVTNLRFLHQPPAAESNYLYELDKATQEILTTILEYQKDHLGEGGGEVSITQVDNILDLPPSPVTLPQLQRLRRQFISLNRQHSLSMARIRELFVTYLNDNFL
ncbi:MAG: hypothetical protein M1819_002586 [Sarea resinae]|nr:MAG: hypothetical protein M1819_002586 [Sarea resinae]